MPVSKKARKKYVKKHVLDPALQTHVTRIMRETLTTVETGCLLKLRTGELSTDEIIAVHNLLNACSFMLIRRKRHEFKDMPVDDYYQQVFEANQAVVRAYRNKKDGKTSAYVFRGEEISLVLDTLEACCDLLREEVTKAPTHLVWDYFGGVLLRVGFDKQITKLEGERYVTPKQIDWVYEQAKIIAALPDKKRKAFMAEWGLVDVDDSM